MRKKLTLTIDEEVYAGLHKNIGPRKISKFIEELVRPHVIHPDLESAYADMAKDEKREKEDEKRTEKVPDEKFRRDPVRGITLAVILIWGGIVAFLSVGNIVTATWWQGWAVFLAGTGVILLIKAAFPKSTKCRIILS